MTLLGVTEREIKFEVIGVRQSVLQMRCKAVAWRHVKADSGQQHNASCHSLGVPRGEGLEDVNFAGDVEIVNAIAETGIRHWPRRCRKRTGDAEHHGNVLDCGIKAGGVAKIKRPCFKAERPRDRIDFCEIAPGQDGARALVGRRFRDQLAGETGRP